jgi:hypothetical protein
LICSATSASNCFWNSGVLSRMAGESKGESLRGVDASVRTWSMTMRTASFGAV